MPNNSEAGILVVNFQRLCKMKYGIDLFCFLYANGKKGIDFHVDLAVAAEDAGWDGFFIWDHIWAFWEGTMGCIDPWIVMAAVAAKTEEIKIGPMVTPIPRRRPSKVARETVSLDHLSNGRLIFGVGLGGTTQEFDHFGETADPTIRGKMLDEGLEVLTGLWSGKPYSFEGEYYEQKEVTFLPKPVQKKIPIWVAGFWPRRKPFQRAARYDGVFPHADWEVELTPERMEESLSIIKKERGNLKNYDIVVLGNTTGDKFADSEKLQPWADAGMTWWMENLIDWGKTPEDMLKRVKQGPPDI